jgi:hypothetical protein
MARTTRVFQQATRRLRRAANPANQNPLSKPAELDLATAIVPS